MKRSLSLKIKMMVLILPSVFLMYSCQNPTQKMEMQLKDFIASYEARVKPLQKSVNLASWNATISGKDEDYKKSEDLQNQLVKVYADRDAFARLKKIKESGAVKDTLLKRELDVLYLTYLGAQVDTAKLSEVIRMQTEIEKIFNTNRTEVNGKKLTDNDVEEFLKTSTNSEELKLTWNSSKLVGDKVADKIRALVKKRNEIAKELGFKSYHEMSLKLSEQDPQEIEKLFDELDNLTRDAFTRLKSEMDDYFAVRYKIKKEELMPWHYQNRFFQEAPRIYSVDLDKFYKSQDVVKLTRDFYNGIDLSIDNVLAHSDLYEKPGKYQHAYCTDIDNEGDVRVLCNVRNNSDWMGTMLHECGHAAYDKYISMDLPFALRNPAHTFTTEAIAMIMGRFARHPQWIKDMTGISEDETQKIAEDCHKSLRLEQLVFSRWAQVMYRFEKSMYENPDQDLNQLWWNLIEKYQLLKKPEGRNAPDWATKIHIATVPCYYHNYLLGELLASQLYFYIAKNVVKTEDVKSLDFVGRPEVGKYLKEKVFVPGARYFWNDMIQQATGEKLTPKYYALQFVK
ncbi:MAG: M2 family metallopeptidase [Bacteroidetes bacterium]|nr:M2 family metallopeptidase [Bacteroidota bacterium]